MEWQKIVLGLVLGYFVGVPLGTILGMLLAKALTSLHRVCNSLISKLSISRKGAEVKVGTNCLTCNRNFEIPVALVNFRVCKETDWHSMVYTCPKCGARNTSPVGVVMAELLDVEWHPWSLNDEYVSAA